MVAGTDYVDILLGVDVVLEETLRRRGVVQAIALDAVASINDKEINAFAVGLFP